MYGKISYCLDIGDINYLRFFETKFPAIVYDDALRLDFSSEPTLSSQHVDEVNWKNKTSLSKYDDEKYNVISKRKALKKRFSKKENFNILSIDKDLFSYDIFSVNDLKLDKDNDEDKIVPVVLPPSNSPICHNSSVPPLNIPAFEMAAGLFIKSSQVRIMGANEDNEDSEKTVVMINLVPLGEKFENFTAYVTAQRLWLKQVPIKSSLFGDYEVLFVKYP
ncbi:hypothetical protein Tco_0117046, partial [Tanacetum coccineum]